MDVLQRFLHELKIGTFLFNGYAASLYSAEVYFKKSMELLSSDVRRELFVPGRPVKTKERSDVSTYYGPAGKSSNCLIADGCYIEGEVKDSILFRGVRVEKGAKVSNCILMQDTVIHSRTELNYVITDKEVVVNSDSTLMGHESYPMTISKGSVI
jgi:glucose-1-phosphate adenylyltransferase